MKLAGLFEIRAAYEVRFPTRAGNWDESVVLSCYLFNILADLHELGQFLVSRRKCFIRLL